MPSRTGDSGRFMPSTRQRLADALRHRVQLLRSVGFESQTGEHGGQLYCAWVHQSAGVCSAVIVTIADQDVVACQIRADDLPSDLLADDPAGQEWRVTGSFLRASDQLLLRIASESGTFFPPASPAADRPPFI